MYETAGPSDSTAKTSFHRTDPFSDPFSGAVANRGGSEGRTGSPEIPSVNRFLRGEKQAKKHLAISALFCESFGSSEDDSFGS
jgi:hypothetical protein